MTNKNFYLESVLFVLYIVFISIIRFLTLPVITREKLDDGSIIETIDTTPLLNNNKFLLIISITFIFVIFRVILLQNNFDNVNIQSYLQLTLISTFIFLFIGTIAVVFVDYFQLQNYSILVRRLICGLSIFIYFYFLNTNILKMPNINETPLLFKNLTHCFSIFMLGILIDIYFIWFLIFFLVGSMIPIRIYDSIINYISYSSSVIKQNKIILGTIFIILGIILGVIYFTNIAQASGKVGPWLMPIMTGIMADQHFFGGRLTGNMFAGSGNGPQPMKIINKYGPDGSLRKSTTIYSHGNNQSYPKVVERKSIFSVEESKSNKSSKRK